jgi:Arc/MetJ-type ribon-helix-helix transcriptional regulator
MTIALDKDVEEFLAAQVRAGVSANPSELLNDLVRSLRQQQQAALEVSPELGRWLLEASDKPATPLTKADFDGIRQRVRSRSKASPS